ncbi:alpha/beta hydrolase [Algoriphagus sp. H41]|uniref:Alpha/beta hydrolase n=1 Tax=Algoriphagus oliviformis TaxID=2811231 RepID=A0ABS3C322_9BACT|nr:alpha/beta hydrolase [Algoriphagus oliviformis]MBN7810541.1 alpha/beta hydrolase [Algoriphagus oliviformis]
MKWINRIAKLLAVLLLSCVFFFLLLYRGDIPAEELLAKYRTPESHFVKVDGVNVHIRMMGEGQPIILLHGSFASLHTWEAWQKELSQHFLTISLDFPGHGLTGPDELKRYTVQDYRDLVLSLAEKLNVERFHLAGNSMGGAVALEVAATRPDKVLTLALVDASGAPRRRVRTLETEADSLETEKPWIMSLIQNRLFSQILLKCTPKFLFAMNLRDVYGDESRIRAETVERYYELMLREGNREATLARVGVDRKPFSDFGRLNMPTLILWGGKDAWIPVSDAYEFEKSIPGSNLVVFEEAGHVPMEEIPTESVAEYLSFLGVRVRKNYLEPPKQMAYAH